MILVFFVGIFITFIIMILMSKLELSIENLDINNVDNLINNKNLIIKVSLKFGEFCMLQIKFNKNKLANIYAKSKEKKKKSINKKVDMEKIKEEIKKLDIKLELLNLNLELGTEDCVLTSYIVAIISMIISNILPNVINTNNDLSYYKYKIMPIYSNKNLYKINLNCIINAKLVHIIYIIYFIEKGRSDKDERTSNRKSYEYSYE